MVSATYLDKLQVRDLVAFHCPPAAAAATAAPSASAGGATELTNTAVSLLFSFRFFLFCFVSAFSQIFGWVLLMLLQVCPPPPPES